jgi:ADP-ribosylglycohydrolase
MIGAIAGDIIGSCYERRGVKTTDFPLFLSGASWFTDDTVLTVAVAARLLGHGDYTDLFHSYYEAFPHAGYGVFFRQWAKNKSRVPYGSWGNGSAMRVSPIAWSETEITAVTTEAERSAVVTHDHPDGIRGAQAIAVAILLARKCVPKDAIRQQIEGSFGYDLDRSLASIRKAYRFDVSCQGSVPESILAFLESTDDESAVRNAVSLGGDADTMACMAGGIAEAFYGGVPPMIERRALGLLDPRLRHVVDEFRNRFMGSIEAGS